MNTLQEEERIYFVKMWNYRILDFLKPGCKKKRNRQGKRETRGRKVPKKKEL